MIEIRLDSKTLYFGYGDICVGSNWLSLEFREFEPPTEVGTWFEELPENFKWLSEKIRISITSYEEAVELGKLLDSMDGKDNFQFDFKGWRFNFSNWNPKSVETIKKHLSVVRDKLLMCIAC